MRKFKFYARYCIGLFYFNPRLARFLISFFSTAFVTVYFVLSITGPYSMPQKLNSLQSLEPYKLINTYNEPVLPEKESQFKKILFWNDCYGDKSYDVGLGAKMLRKAGCPVWQCSTTADRTKPEDFDAIVFHQRTW